MPKKTEADPQSCASCRFFVPNQTDSVGYCRRFPPVPVAEEEMTVSVFPVTDSADWCGEYVRITH